MKVANWEELKKSRPINEERVKKLAKKMLAQMEAYRLAELRKEKDLTQKEMAQKLKVNQSNISRLERGLFERTEIGTLGAYINALGGTIEIHAKIGKVTYRIVDSKYEKKLVKSRTK